MIPILYPIRYTKKNLDLRSQYKKVAFRILALTYLQMALKERIKVYLCCWFPETYSDTIDFWTDIWSFCFTLSLLLFTLWSHYSQMSYCILSSVSCYDNMFYDYENRLQRICNVNEGIDKTVFWRCRRKILPDRKETNIFVCYLSRGNAKIKNWNVRKLQMFVIPVVILLAK